MVVPAQLYDAADAALTASRIADRSWLLRLGIASELFHQAILRAYLMLVLYDFFKPVSARPGAPGGGAGARSPSPS